MSTPASVLQQGIEAMRNGRYGDAIPLLEDWCSRTGPWAERYPEAVRVLMQAYQEIGDLEAAIALCQDLSDHDNEALKHWAWQLLPSLSQQLSDDGPRTEFVTLPHAETGHTALQISQNKSSGDTPEQRQILASGLEALAAQQYEKAVERLERYLQLKKQFDPAKPQTHVALARAYQGNRQRREAIQLCQHLLKVGDKGTRIWAHQFMEAIQQHPRARDPLAAIRGEQAEAIEIRWDVTTKATIVGLHGSIYGGLLLSPLVPGTLWKDLGLALMREGSISLDLLLPLAIALAPLTVPLALFLTSDDDEIRSHAREVVNYWITTLAIALLLSVFGAGLGNLTAMVAKLPLVLNLVRLLVWGAGLSYALGPLLAVVWCFWKPQKLFRYPFILRLV